MHEEISSQDIKIVPDDDDISSRHYFLMSRVTTNSRDLHSAVSTNEVKITPEESFIQAVMNLMNRSRACPSHMN